MRHPVKVLWPTAMEFTNGGDDWYTLLTEGQGLLIPNTWKTELGKLSFDGRFETSGGYMPWFGQVKERCRVVTELYEKTALLELVRHECMTADGSVQFSLYFFKCISCAESRDLLYYACGGVHARCKEDAGA